jgi:hypothetical protein
LKICFKIVELDKNCVDLLLRSGRLLLSLFLRAGIGNATICKLKDGAKMLARFVEIFPRFAKNSLGTLRFFA